MLRLGNALSHSLHLIVITFSVIGWAFEETRLLHLILCGLVLFSWFILGPLIGKPGYCFLTGLQHWLWRKSGEANEQNYMCYLYKRVTKRTPTESQVKRIDFGTQAVLYTSTLMSLLLL